MDKTVNLADIRHRLAEGMKEHRRHPAWACDHWGCNDIANLVREIERLQAQLAAMESVVSGARRWSAACDGWKDEQSDWLALDLEQARDDTRTALSTFDGLLVDAS